MGSPGIPGRLRKIASIAGGGPAHQEQAQFQRELRSGDGRDPAEPDLDSSEPEERAQNDGEQEEAVDAGIEVRRVGPAGTGAVATGRGAAEQTGVAEPAAPAPPGKGLADRRGSSRRPRRGRPRSEQADRAILTATIEVLAEKGMAGMSIEEVATRAKVGKTTIYRRWSSRGTLALDAFRVQFEGQQVLPDTGSFAGDLRAALGAWVNAVLRTDEGALLVGLIAEIQQDKGLAVAWQDQVIAPLRAQYSIMLDRAIRRGEIPAHTDAGVVLDLVFGACYYRLLHGHRPLNEQFVNQVVDVVAAGVGARTSLGTQDRREVRN